ncbi:signal-induced proliferation-associated 1-like protein 3 [Amphibalanus amphitrite]|uniref:signal-induced proliferation-associated 1-like protein 3 n=1 Tax=Amphibalanus amphitrite TaxID=1232801 RepID=UPI001C90641D|nr:signal-induced proliferation-associated 1-like protein 3 [Amphibalanus amphitrite]
MEGAVMPPPAPVPAAGRLHTTRERAYVQTRLQSYTNGASAARPPAFGPSSLRSSYNERLYPRHRERVLAQHGGPRSLREGSGAPPAAVSTVGMGPLYRSSSSLELETSPGGGLRREFGSHGSIDVMAGGGDAPGLGAPRAGSATGSDASPRLKSRLQRLWDRDRRGSRKTAEPSLFRKLRGGGARAEPETSRSSDSLDGEARLEERRRRRALVHYDCQSLQASLSAAQQQRSQLAKRRNTATGASAAAAAGEAAAAAAAESSADDLETGDGRSNDLVLSCPFFRNETGGELDRAVNVGGSWAGAGAARTRRPPAGAEPLLHRPAAACGLSVLEKPRGMSHWPAHVCPFRRAAASPESCSLGSYYYKDFFYGKEHENWVGTDDVLGPVAVSVRRDQLEGRPAERGAQPAVYPCYRIIIRSSELPTVRALILDEALCQLAKPAEKLKRLPVREILDHVAPELQASCLRLAIPEQRTEDYLMKLDEQNIFTRYKVGIMYCRAGQSTEEEMYNNEQAGPAFDEFLDMLGQRVRLKGFDKYKAGLDNKTDSTGQYSVYAQYRENEIMFHVSTMLQFSPNNRQQLLRKRYIGNDIVTIVFQEPGALPFTPKHIRSQFQHVFIVVQAVEPCSERTRYRVAVNRFRDVPPFGPPIPEDATFPKSQSFAEFLYAKVINAETAAYQSDKFVTMARRTRQEYLRDLAANYLTETPLDASPKFSIMSFSSRKKDRLRPRFNPDAIQRGAISWQVTVDDHSLGKQVDCLLGVSADSLVLAEESAGALLFAAPVASVLGWTLRGTSLCVYYHQGECVVLHPRTSLDTEELAEIAARLAAVSEGADTQELLLRRNAMGQLGFHVQHDGLVTEVENYSPAWQAGLRPNAKLVQICQMAVCTMTHDQMVDLLKTSVTVSVTVIPPAADGAPRRGCLLASCGAPLLEGDYENVPARAAAGSGGQTAGAGRQQSANRPAPETRPASPPPPSVVSSGYGTGGSGRSFGAPISLSPEASGTLSSSSSGSADRWLEPDEAESPPPPPPLPTRHRQRVAATRSAETAAPPGGQTDNYGRPQEYRRSQPAEQGRRPDLQALDYIELTSLPRPVKVDGSGPVGVRLRSTYPADRGPDRPPLPQDYYHLSALVPSSSAPGSASGYARLGPSTTSAPAADLAPGRTGRTSSRERLGAPQENGYGANGTGAGTLKAGVTNGVTNGVSNGVTNGVTNGGVNGITNGSMNGMANGVVNGVTNGVTNGMSNGVANGVGSGGSHGQGHGSGRPCPGLGLAGSGRLHDYSGSYHVASQEYGSGPDLLAGFPHRHTSSTGSPSLKSASPSSVSSAGGRRPADADPLERPLSSRSEDELSAASGSPATRRRLRAAAATPSTGSGSSRTQSPRGAAPAAESGAARRRPGAAARSSVHRASGAGASLQRELMRLIGPDEPPPAASPPEQGVIVTTARPATVIASPAAAGAAWREDLRRVSRQERLSPRVTAGPARTDVPLPPVGPVDWQALVDTATRAGKETAVATRSTQSSGVSQYPRESRQSPSEELRSRLTLLERELVTEQTKRELLESQVFQLSSDNRRLQEESKQAAHQLRKFTEWFFNNMEKP